MATHRHPTTSGGGLFLDAVLLLALAGASFAVRVGPAADVSLWWDELIHLQTASGDGFLDVFWAAKLGIPPGFGNAGAVPLDYLLLHAWLRIAPEPSPEGLELYYRTPALIWSIGCVLATYVYGRRFFDRGVGLVAATLLALSVPHSLYAAEVRFYSLFALMTVANLYAFSNLALKRTNARPWVVYTLVGVFYFTTGFFALLVMLVQYGVLFVLLARDARRAAPARRGPGLARLGLPFASGLVILGVVGLYLHGTFLGVRYGRPVEGLSAWERTQVAFDFYAGGNPLLLAAFLIGIPALLSREWKRDPARFAAACALVGSFAVIPVIVEIERMKEYYFHPRHTFFLMPIFALIAASGLLAPVRRLDLLRRLGGSAKTRDAAYVATGVVVALGLSALPLESYLANPQPRFARTKTLRGFKPLMRHLRKRVDEIAPDQIYLLLAERGRPGHIGNPMLAKYLQWHGLEDRVVLHGVDVPHATRRQLARVCPDQCDGVPARRLRLQFEAKSPFNARGEMLDLVGVAPDPPSRRPVGGVGLLHYWRYVGGPPARAEGFRIERFRGLSFFEPIRPTENERTSATRISAPGSRTDESS